MVKKYYGNGKLLLSGEYLVLDGAKALSLPVKFGQHTEVKEDETKPGVILWKAKEHDLTWFEAELELKTLNVISSTDEVTANFVTDMFLAIQESFVGFESFESLSFEHSVNFPLNWGLGSSSSLISNMATWSLMEPYELHQRVSAGSGYDVFTARCHKPIMYQLVNDVPHVTEIHYQPSFSKQLYFVYQGQKQNTAMQVEEYKKKEEQFMKEITRINTITEEMIHSTSYGEFETLLREHEDIISRVLDRKPLIETTFSDYKYGFVKSLGAWGGDFMLFTLREENHPQLLLEYLNRKQLDTVFQYKDLILDT